MRSAALRGGEVVRLRLEPVEGVEQSWRAALHEESAELLIVTPKVRD
jgi:hypothetical protein